MRLSEISLLLSGSLKPEEFRSLNARDLAEYRTLTRQKGSSVPIKVEEDLDVIIGANSVISACSLFARGKLKSDELAYIADVLQLSERVAFTDESIELLLAGFTDPEANGEFTAARAARIIRALELNKQKSFSVQAIKEILSKYEGQELFIEFIDGDQFVVTPDHEVDHETYHEDGRWFCWIVQAIKGKHPKFHKLFKPGGGLDIYEIDVISIMDNESKRQLYSRSNE